MQSPGSVLISLKSLFRGVKHAQVVTLAVFGYAGNPAFAALSNAAVAGSVGSAVSRVDHVLPRLRQTKIAQAVVVTFAVNVIDLVWWPFTVGEKPGKPVGIIQFAQDENPAVTVDFGNVASNVTLPGFFAT